VTIRRLLVANRAEIAIRVARAARELGIVPLGIYSEADAQAYHLRFMDEARCIGPAPATQSYLKVEAVLEAARALHADALHPGYGFLSENPAFAAGVRNAGMIFVGPSPEAMAAAGSKIEAKRRASAAGVPTVPGYDGEDRSTQRLLAEALRIGFPVLIKASAGGGGRGMRLVREPHEFEEALEAAKREAYGAFGDDTVLIERYLDKPRHIEFQILADARGKIVHLGERECSIQRRHQKIVEETPSVAVTPELRAAMGNAAITVAAAVGYVNAGTVEFMLDRNGYYFLEMNARLQVEHPVTEEVYGVDLVQWQLRIADGEPLSVEQHEIVPRGSAIEMRITAEDPARGMLPSSGRISRWEPPSGPGVRIDGGVTEGSDVGLFYDSMLAKLIVYASDRPSAIARIENALESFHVEGIRTNLPLLRWIAGDEAFRSGNLSTAFLDERLDESLFTIASPPQDAVLLAVGALLLDAAAPWRIGSVGSPIFIGFEGGSVALWATQISHSRWNLDGDLSGTLEARRSADVISTSFDGVRSSGSVSRDGPRLFVRAQGRDYELRIADPLEAKAAATTATGLANGKIASPMPGRILRIAVSPGERVQPHQLLVVLEAMKMEHRIEASLPATVESVFVNEGEIVSGGTPLVELAAS
jgi:3-methylcrotonyl-CoA carboxylase alpha subunit